MGKSQKCSATLTNEPTRRSMEVPTAWQGLQALCFHTEIKGGNRTTQQQEWEEIHDPVVIFCQALSPKYVY